MDRSRPKDLSIVLCGEAGQGIQTIEVLLTRVLSRSGFRVFATKEYMSRVRGGSNSTQIRLSSSRVAAPLNRIDVLIPLDADAIPHLRERIGPGTAIIGEPGKLATDLPLIPVPFSALASEAGNRIYENTVALGVLAGLLAAEEGVLEGALREQFARKEEAVLAGNLAAARKGYAIGRGLCAEGRVPCGVDRDPSTAGEVLLSGAEAVALGCLSGGCDFLAAYPMTPSTGIMTFLAPLAERFGMVVEQAEDEIAAMNMALGAWYAGARALVSTSGGGFALMVEGLSLAGAIESPVVVHLAQRPGPATGLPTRTEQADLLFALFAGHGEFPRALLAPGSIEQAFALSRRAFDLADRWQVPVFLLTDQFLVDGIYNLPPPDLSGLAVKKALVKTGKDYRRYAPSPDGVSPRGIPGFGDGLVCVDSDEHDEEGHITESMAVRKAMVEKRLRKGAGLAAESLPPELIGSGEYSTLVVGWGSTRSIILEALESLGRPGLSCLHFSQVWPLPAGPRRLLDKAGRIVTVEQNAGGQFGQLLRNAYGRPPDAQILKYDGLPFTVEELAKELSDAG